MAREPRTDRGRRRPGLETTEVRTMRRGRGTVPPPPDAVAAGAYPAVLSGATSALVGTVMIIAAVFVLIDAARLPTTSDPLGPAAFPFAIGALLGIVGLSLAVRYHRYALVLLRVRRSGLRRRGRGLRAAAVVGALLLFAAVLPFVGFFLAAAALYVGVALLLGAPRGWHLPIAGVLVAGAIVLLFDRLIGLTLPAGPWGF